MRSIGSAFVSRTLSRGFATSKPIRLAPPAAPARQRQPAIIGGPTFASSAALRDPGLELSVLGLGCSIILTSMLSRRAAVQAHALPPRLLSCWQSQTTHARGSVGLEKPTPTGRCSLHQAVDPSQLKPPLLLTPSTA